MFRFLLTGVVQGVGFRPFVYARCTEASVHGYVMNIGNGVVIVSDNKEVVDDLLMNLPSGARIDTLRVTHTNEQCTDFSIRESDGEGYAEIPSDLFLCPQCAQELHEPTNRRHGYFFLTCTHCGPRFSIASKSPYDRDTTTMQDFPMCPHCQTEYTDPTNRRYHAQTIACHECGPRLALYHDVKVVVEGTGVEVVQAATDLLAQGELLAMKGVGGFHLACTARRKAIQKLKDATGRHDKPFALLVKDSTMARRIAVVNEAEAILLESVERPIVILERGVDLPHVSELNSIGIMLPSTALHYLLFEHLDEPLVLTSSNQTGAPITTKREQQFVSSVLDHNRRIANSIDDSLVKVVRDTTFYIRRSRGFVPRSLAASTEHAPPTLALGAEMNSTFSLYHNGRITPSQYLGNTTHLETYEHFQETVRAFMQYTDIHPQNVCTDLHPDFNTTRFGQELAHELDAELVTVQHHKAHAYSIALEHDVHDFTAIIADGMGYGEDGTIWGGEVFHNDERIGHLETHLQLGGDSATKHPTKMAYSILRKFLSREDAAKQLGDVFTKNEYALLGSQWEKKLNAPLTSSCGRMLDAAAALLGICTERTYDGRPAMLLESASTEPLPLTPVIVDNVLMTTPLFEFLVMHSEESTGRLAATVEHYLAEGLFAIASQYDRPILWGGGCAYNRRMTTFMLDHGALTNKAIPAGDGGVSVGQIGYSLRGPVANSYL